MSGSPAGPGSVDSTAPIGWYVHHQGAGHLTRFAAIRPHLDAPVVVFSSLSRPAELASGTDWIELARDDTAEGGVHPSDRDPTANSTLHWAPLGHRGHASRLAAIATAIADRGIRTMVVDVSVEVTELSRLLGAAVVVIAQPGDRSDGIHQRGYRMAAAIVAPWPADARLCPGLDAHRDRTVYVGGISRFDGRARRAETEPGTILVSTGAGGDLPIAALHSADALPGWTTRRIGGDGTGARWVDDPWDLICTAEVVISSAGQNAVADLAAAGARLIVVPQHRPFDEQRTTARALQGMGLARSAPAESPDWAALVESARGEQPDWSRWQVAGAAGRAAALIARVAEAVP